MKKFHDLACDFVYARNLVHGYVGLRVFTNKEGRHFLSGYIIDRASMAEIDAWEIERSIGLAAKRQHKAETI